MAAVDVDVVESALRDVNLSSGREIVLKPEQESAVRALLADRDVLAVLPTGYGKSLIYQIFVRAKNYELNGNAAILVISPLKSIIEDQLQEMELLGYPAKDLANLSNDDIRRCNFKIVFATAENSKSKLHRNISAIVVELAARLMLHLGFLDVFSLFGDQELLLWEVLVCSSILVNRFPLFHCPSPNR